MQQQSLYLLYEDDRQIQENAFVAQLHETLAKSFSIVGTSRDALIEGAYTAPPENAIALSLLRLRNWSRLLPFIARYAEEAGLFLYDQDPWEAYHDKASSPGAYPTVGRLLNTRGFLVTSGWWADYIRDREQLPVTFVRMGISPSLCDLGPPFAARSHELGFQGAVHGHRRAFFDRMQARGLRVDCLPRQPFLTFLETVQDIGIFVYDDSSAITLDGEPSSFHGLWGKSLTVAGRGCFVIRNEDLGKPHYAINELPTVFTFQSEDEVPGIVDMIRGMPEEERNNRRRTAVSRIRERDDWTTIVTALRQNPT
jgi:hypothetical protein